MDDTQVKVLGGLWRNVNQVHSAAMRYGWTVDAYRTAMLATLTGEPAAPAPDSEKLREELTRIRTSMVLLQQNSEGCALNHYGGDGRLHGMPGWLMDTAVDIERLTDILKAMGASQ